MPKRSKVLMPRWYRWFINPVLFIVWVVITYQTFWTRDGREEVGLFGWIAVTALLGLIAVVTWLMSSGRLPAYIIEEDSKD